MIIRNIKTALCAAMARSREPGKRLVTIARPAQIIQPCVLGNVLKDITL
jgi:hypothetical protein